MSPQSSSKPSGDSLSACSSLCINQGYAKQEISEPDTITPVGSHIARHITRKYRDGFSCIFPIMNAVWAICNRFPICSKVESMSSLCQYQANKQFFQIQRSKHIVLAAIWISRTIIRTTLIRLHVPYARRSRSRSFEAKWNQHILERAWCTSSTWGAETKVILRI